MTLSNRQESSNHSTNNGNTIPRNMYFISTGVTFPYMYYLAVISALRIHTLKFIYILISKEIKERNYKYLNILADMPGIIIKYVDIDPNDFSALKDLPAWFADPHIKDYIQWNVLYHNGGITVDLDTFSVRDIVSLLTIAEDRHSEVMTSPCAKYGLSLNPFNNAIVAARPKSLIIQECVENTIEILQNEKKPLTEEDWGITGPGIFSRAVMNNIDKAYFPPNGTFGEIQTELYHQIDMLKDYKETKLSNELRIAHLYNSVNRQYFGEFDEQEVKTGTTLLVKTIKDVLPESDIYPVIR